MVSIHINEKLYSDLLITEDKSIVQVICDTEVLKEIYEMLRVYIMEADNYSAMAKMKYFSKLSEQISVVVKRNQEAKNIYKWLYSKDFVSSEKSGGSYLKNQDQLLAELRVLVQKWDEDETDGELMTEAIIAAFRFTKHISANAS